MYGLITALAVVLALMGVLLVVSEDSLVVQTSDDIKKLLTNELVIVEHDVAKTSKRTNVVTEDYVRDLDKDANLVIKTKAGSAYAVKSGTVLVEGRVVTVEGEDKQVNYLDTPVKSVSTE